MKKKSGFTLIELMIAVSILTIGIVAVLRSFLSSQNFLDVAQNKVLAIRILDEKMDQIEESRRVEAALPKEEDAEQEGQATAQTEETEEIIIGNRKALLKQETSFLEQDVQENNEETGQALQAVSRIEEVKLTISWREGEKQKDEVLAAYFEKKI